MREESRQVKRCLREVAATLGLPLPSFSQWRREARTQACMLLGTQGDLQPLDLGLHPSSSCWWAPLVPSASLSLRVPFLQLRPGVDMRSPASRPGAPCIL